MRVISQPGWKYFCNALHRRYTVAERYFSNLATFARVFSVRVHIKYSITFDSSYTSVYASLSQKRYIHARQLRPKQFTKSHLVYRSCARLWCYRYQPKYYTSVTTLLYGLCVDCHYQKTQNLRALKNLSWSRLECCYKMYVSKLDENGTLVSWWVCNEFTMNLLQREESCATSKRVKLRQLE